MQELLFRILKLLLLEEFNALFIECFFLFVASPYRITRWIQVGADVFVSRTFLFDLPEEVAGILHLGLIEGLNGALITLFECLLGNDGGSAERYSRCQTKDERASKINRPRALFAPGRQPLPQETRSHTSTPTLFEQLLPPCSSFGHSLTR